MDASNRTTVGGDLEAAGAGFARAAAAAQRSIASALFGTGGPARAIAGRYQLGERLGAGAQGAVWKARDEALDRDVAIKTAHVAGSSGLAKAQEWLRHEAKMLGRVSHPNVVGVFDVGIDAASVFGLDDDGAVIFVVMELVRGRTLAQWLQEKPRTTSEIDAVFVAIATGLQAVHDAGLVHCDVKPGNIFVTEHGVAKLGDFGLAHAQRRLAEAVQGQGESSDATTTVASTEVTQTSGAGKTGPRGGTPAYMPPEQFRGARVDARADQYAFAGTWFEAMFRMLPHGRGTHARLFEAKIAGPPSRPGPAMTSRAFRALARGLAPDPRRRHASVVELARAVTERKPSRGLALAGAGAIAVVGAMVLAPKAVVPGCEREALDEQHRLRFSLDVADDVVTYDQQLAHHVTAMWDEGVDARLEARRAACEAPDPDRALLACLDRIDRFAETSVDIPNVRGRNAFQRAFSVISQLPEPDVCTSGNADAAMRDFDADALELDTRRLTAQLIAAAELLDGGRPAEALTTLEQIDSTAPAAAAFINEIDLLRASALEPLGRVDESFTLHRAAWDRAIASDAALDAARAATGLAHIVGYRRQDFEGGTTWVRHGQAQLARIGSIPVLESQLFSVSALVLTMHGEYVPALAAANRALELLPDAPLYEAARIGIEENAAQLSAIVGDPDAEERIRRVLAWREEHLGSDHPDIARTLLAVAFVEQKQGQLDTADALLRRALALRKSAPDPDELEIAKIYGAVASVASDSGDVRATLEAYDRADEIHARLLGPDHPSLADTAFLRLNLLVRAGEFEAADQFASAVRDRLAGLSRVDTNRALDLAHLLARVDTLAGRQEKGRAALEEVIAEALRRGTHQRQLAMWSAQLASTSGAAGDLDAAILWTDRAAGYLAEYGGDDVAREHIEMLRAVIANTQADAADR